MCEKDVDKSLSDDIFNGFKPLEYTLETIEFVEIYKKIYSILPKETIKFDSFDRETLIACEIVCAAICHKINWEFLRNAIYKKTISNPTWLKASNLAIMTFDEVYDILSGYEKKDRIMEKERCYILNILGETLVKSLNNFEEIFFDVLNQEYKNFKDILPFFKTCKVFTSDPQHKKMQLLLQSLSDYPQFNYLSEFYKPTIDYHLIRLYLRRGVVKPTTQFALNYIFNTEAVRKEITVATLRKVCADSLDTISWITSFDLKQTNRIEWWVGRAVCVNGIPDCYLEFKKSEWLKSSFDKCPYYYCCYARQCDEKFLEISEPLYKGSSY